MIDLVITHLTHPWGPPWTLETLGDLLENDHFGGNWSFSSMSPRVAKVCEGLRPECVDEGISRLRSSIFVPKSQRMRV